MTSRFTRTRALALVALVLVFMLALAASAGAADTTTVVNPADIGGPLFSVVYTEAGGSSAIVSGPATPPLGTGSLQMTTGPAADKRYNMTTAHAGQLLSAITHLSYATYGNSNLLAPVLQVTIDPDGAGSGVPKLGGGPLVNFATVSFEPYHANTVTPGVWQSWNAMTDGASVWASNVAGDAGNGTQANPATWAEFVAFYPNAVIGGFGVNVGKGWSSPFTGATDALKIGYGGDTWTYDFDPVVLCTTVCYADAINGNDLNGGASAADAFKTIQKAIDTVQPGGEIRVLPGTYDQDEKNGMDPNTGGAGGDNFNIFVNKADITIQGVTAGDVDITTVAGAAAYIMPKRSVPSFGVSTMFIQADGVTVQGVKFYAKNGLIQAAKTVEIIGNDVTMDAVAFDTTGPGSGTSGIYISDFLYDTGANISTVPDYTFTNNRFVSTAQTGMGIYVASGAGWPDNVGTRTISGNTFIDLDDAIVFAGPGSAAWLNYPVGTADITGNTFNQIKRRHLLVFGDGGPTVGYADPDWCGILTGNTFDKGTMLWAGTTTCPTGQPRRWTSGAFTNVAGIYSAIQQYGIGRAVAGDLLQILPGTYPELVTVDKSMTLRGAGDGANPLVDTILDGTDLSGSGIYLNNNVTNVTVEHLRVQDYNLVPAAGVYGIGGNNGLTVQHVTTLNNGHASGSGGGIYMNGPVDDVLIDDVVAHNNRTRGIVIWNGFKTNITITNNDVQNNDCCGIELQDGTASGVTVTGNTVKNNKDSGMAFIGLMAGAGPNLIANNTLENNGRFGIEIKLPNGTGLATGDGSIVVENNTVSLNPAGQQNNASEERDLAGIAVIRRAWWPGNNNVDIPTGVIVRNNTVSGYQQNHGSSTSTGFGIVIEGTNSRATGNTLNNNDVGIQAQAGHLPYVANTTTDGDQSDLADDFFGRGNSPLTCATILPNTFSGNDVDSRFVGTAGGQITNVNTSESFCSIQAAVDDAQTLNGHTISVPAGTYTENVTVHKSLTINGANAGISPNDSVTPLNPNGARGPESVMAMTGGGIAFKATTANVTIDGFKFTDTAVDVAHVQTPFIGAGVNFGGDAPGVKIINNLFYQTNRNLVTFNGPAMMQGGTIDNNRVENPGRPDTGCTSAPNTTPPSACGHQLFNPWRTNNLSFQHNVAFAPANNRDRVRTINVSWSTNVLIKYNTLRYTCIYTCISIPLDASPVEVAYNDAVTDAGQVLALHPTWTTGTINAHHNLMTTGADFPISIDNVTADLDNVHINRNAIFGTYHARNGTDNLVTPGAETLDVTCNWWGSAAGPTPANFFGPNDFDPWLSSSNLDGPCAINSYLVSAEAPGTTDDNVVYGLEDILEWDIATGAWSKWFDGSDAGLTPNGKAMHNIIATYIPDPDADTFYMAFAQNARAVPGITGKVDGMDLVKWDGAAFSLYFDGQDVGLTGKSQEKIDAIHFLDPDLWTFDGTTCQAYLLISTQGPGQVKNYNGGKLKFSGEDILGFCLTQSGAVTTGKWAMFLDGSTQGMPKQSTSGLSANAAGTEIYITTKGTFNVDTATGTHSMVYVYNIGTQSFSGPIFNATVEGLPTRVDALDIAFD